jgi:rubrerythrin
MADCKCELKLVDGASSVIVLTSPCVTHKDVRAETFRLRAWVIDEGVLYNSYREDTGTTPETGLAFKPSPWHFGQFVCDLTPYLQRESAAEIPVGVNLFADGVLTAAQGRIRFRRAPQVDGGELSKRMDGFVRRALAQNKDLADPGAYVESVERELKDEWLMAFADPPSEPSARFDLAVRQAVRSSDDSRRAHERHERQQTMTALQRAEEQAKDAMEQVRVLTEHIKELEIEARRTQVRHQTEIAALRAQIQKTKSGGDAKGGPTEWACSVCTFLNPMDKPKCSMCTAAREKGKDGEGKHN